MKVCKYCQKEIEGKHSIYANHVRWCEKNDTNGDKGRKKLSEASYERYEQINGKLKTFEVICNWCKNIFEIQEFENKFPIKEKYFCKIQCSNNRIMSEENKKKISNKLKEHWKNPEYVKNIIKNNTVKNKRFTSKGEEELKKFLKDNFTNDNWTSGGGFRYKDVILSRDMYSNQLKTIVEYDGIWHFKDIHGQLEEKQLKDALLEEWCINNNWRLIRIKDDLYQKEKEKYRNILIDSIYKEEEQIIKIY